MLVKHEPQVQKLVEQPYVAIWRQVTDGVPAAVDSGFRELFGWLGEYGVKPSGPPFIRFLEVDVQGEPLELEVAVPVVGGLEADDRVREERPGTPPVLGPPDLLHQPYLRTTTTTTYCASAL
jgi:hypothetical protein